MIESPSAGSVAWMLLVGPRVLRTMRRRGFLGAPGRLSPGTAKLSHVKPPPHVVAERRRLRERARTPEQERRRAKQKAQRRARKRNRRRR